MPAAGVGCCSLWTAFFDWQNEQVDQRCTEEGLLVACDICQLRLPNCLETGLLLLFNYSMWLSGIITIMNSNSDSASPWNIPLWTFASAKLLPSAVNSTSQVFMVFSIKFMISSDILYILRQFIIQVCGPYHMPFCSQSRP